MGSKQPTCIIGTQLLSERMVSSVEIYVCDLILHKKFSHHIFIKFKKSMGFDTEFTSKKVFEYLKLTCLIIHYNRVGSWRYKCFAEIYKSYRTNQIKGKTMRSSKNIAGVCNLLWIRFSIFTSLFAQLLLLFVLTKQLF